MTTLVSPREAVSQKIVPRDYQQVGIDFLRDIKRGALHDSPGLGKTIQASEAAELPALVVAPNYITQQWTDFLMTQYPDLNVVNAAKGSRFQRVMKLNECDQADWIVINTEMLRSYEMPSRQTVIFDESHHLRGRVTLQALGALKVALGTPRVYQLTGTPIYKEADDLWMQLHLLDPINMPDYDSFLARFLDVEWKRGARSNKRVLGIRDVKGLQMLIEKYALRRSYSDVGLELPDLIEENILCPLPDIFRRKYDETRDYWRMQELTFDNIMQVMQILRMITAASPTKHEALKDLLGDIRKPTVVFCWYRDTVKVLARQLGAYAITGEMNATERSALARAQNELAQYQRTVSPYGTSHQDPPIIVATIASLKEGVDLSNFRAVVFYEEDYTPGGTHQALSRIRRWRREGGNDEPVLAFHMLAKDTIDEIIYAKVTQRISDVRSIIREALE